MIVARTGDGRAGKRGRVMAGPGGRIGDGPGGIANYYLRNTDFESIYVVYRDVHEVKARMPVKGHI